MREFRNHMKPFPTLAGWANQVRLPEGGTNVFFFDTGAEAGEGSPVVLLHGLGDEADTWRHVIPLVYPKHRVIALDLPGFGRSEKVKRKHSIPFFVDTVLGLLDHLDIQKAILTGHSTGAVIAHAFALAHPARVDRLVLIGGSLVSGEARLNRDLLLFLLPFAGEWRYNQLRKDPQAAYRSLEAYYSRLEALPQADRDFLYQRVNERVWSDGQRMGFLSTLRNLATWLPAQQKRLPDQLRDFRIPTTIVWGENDAIMPAANAQALRKLLPDANLLLVPEAGHNVQQEQPEAVAQAILQTEKFIQI